MKEPGESHSSKNSLAFSGGKWLKNILFGAESGLSHSANAGLVLLRLFAGTAMAIGHGLSKIPPPDEVITGIGGLGFPLPHLFAWLAGLAELVGGMLLAVGLFTRPAAFFILVTMFVAAFVAHGPDSFEVKELALLYMFIAIAFLLKGSGDWSLDAFLRK